MKIVYVASGINMTFVVNEMEAHRQAGWGVLPLVSCRPRSAQNFSSVMAQWIEKAVFRPVIWVQIASMLREMVTHPVRFFRVCCWLAYLAICNLLEFLKALYELPVACYFASYCRKFDTQHIHVHFARKLPGFIDSSFSHVDNEN